MNIWDVVLILAITAAVIFAIRSIKRGKSNCHGGAGCACCDKNCFQNRSESGGEQ